MHITIYPNPFYENIVVEYFSLGDAAISIKLYDLNGAMVQDLYKGETEESHKYTWEFTPSDDLPNGTYLLVINNGIEPKINKLIYSKK